MCKHLEENLRMHSFHWSVDSSVDSSKTDFADLFAKKMTVRERPLANKNIQEDLTDVGRLVTNIRNNSRRRMLPWGTPQITGSGLVMKPIICDKGWDEQCFCDFQAPKPQNIGHYSAWPTISNNSWNPCIIWRSTCWTWGWDVHVVK